MQRGAVHPHSCSATASMVPDWSEPDPSASRFFFFNATETRDGGLDVVPSSLVKPRTAAAADR